MKKILAVLAIVGFWNLFLGYRLGSMGTVLLLLSIEAFILVVLGTKPKAVAAGLLTAGGLFSLVMLTRSGLFPRMVIILAYMTVLTGGVYLLGLKKKFFDSLGQLICAPFDLLIAEITSGIGIIQRVGDNQLINRKAMRVALGLGLGIPVILVVWELLSTADPVFRFYGDKIFSGEFLKKPVDHLVFSLMWLGFFLPTAFLHVRETVGKMIPKKPNLETEKGVVGLMVAVVLGLFLVVQWKYIFVSVPAETSLAKFGVATYSEYVNKGFGEFILVAVIVYSLCRLGTGRIVNGVLIVEMGIFLISIFKRIDLYQTWHGWSLARIYGGIFLTWVGGMLVWLVGRNWSAKKAWWGEAVWTALIVVFVGLFNAEGFIVRTNPPTVNKQIDYVYLANLSPDGYKGWLMAYDDAKKVLVKEYPADRLINREERREINYAGMIISRLVENYESLQNNLTKGNKWNKLILWNYTEMQTFEKMQKDFSKQILDDLNKKSSDLGRRIDKQPEGERKYDMDVSFSTPLL